MVEGVKGRVRERKEWEIFEEKGEGDTEEQVSLTTRRKNAYKKWQTYHL